MARGFDKNIAKDLCTGNIMTGFDEDALHDRRVEAGKIYLIDFQMSRQLKLPPGRQPAILLPETQVPPPGDLKHFDPYSWDVYCLSDVFQRRLKVWITVSLSILLLTVHALQSYSGSGSRGPWIMRRYIQWLSGTERGCTKACHCRPTARRALRVLIVIRWAVSISTGFGGFATLIMSVFKRWARVG